MPLTSKNERIDNMTIEYDYEEYCIRINGEAVSISEAEESLNELEEAINNYYAHHDLEVND